MNLLKIILFKSKLCVSCKKIEPIFQNLIHEYKDKISMEIIDIQENENLAINFSVLSVPTILFIQNGKEIDRISGYVREEKLKEKIKKLCKD
jgi:thioredoxin 1